MACARSGPRGPRAPGHRFRCRRCTLSCARPCGRSRLAHLLRLARATLAGLLAATGLVATANAAPVPVSVVNWDLIMNSQGFPQKLAGDCLDPSRAGYGWQDFSTHSPFRYTRVFEGVGIAAAGSFDPATRSGSLAGRDPALRVDNYNAHSRAIRVGALGFKTSGAGAVVTGRIERTRTIFSRFGPPKPLLRIKRFTFSTGPFQRKGKDVADTFIMALYGRATVMPALARELTRIRCHGPHIVTSHPIRAGSSFGAVRLQMRPDAATGVGGTFDISKIRVDADSESGQPAMVTPSTLHVELPADLRTPLRCEAAYNCAPAAGAHFALG